jgi:hypothetical protein
MFRTALLTGLAALGLAGSAPAQGIYYPQAPVRPGYGYGFYPPRPPRVELFRVEFRRYRWEPWRNYVVTYDRASAMAYVRHLRSLGFQARIDSCN